MTEGSLQPGGGTVRPPRTVRAPRTSTRNKRKRTRWPWIRLSIMGFAGLAMLALTTDLVTFRLKASKKMNRTESSPLVVDALIDVETTTNRYTDFAGRFTIARPATWAVYPFKQEGDYDVTLRGPHQIEIDIMTMPIGTGGLAAVRAVLDKKEEELRVVTNVEEIEFQGRPAFHRRVPLGTITVEAIDFAEDSLHVHLAASAPRGSFDDLLPVLHAMMDSFRLSR